MSHGLRESIYNYHSRHDEPDSNHGGDVQVLSVEEPTNDRHERDATVLPSAAYMQAKRVEAGGDEVCARGAWADVEDR